MIPKTRALAITLTSSLYTMDRVARKLDISHRTCNDTRPQIQDCDYGTLVLLDILQKKHINDSSSCTFTSQLGQQSYPDLQSPCSQYVRGTSTKVQMRVYVPFRYINMPFSAPLGADSNLPSL